MTAVTPPRQPDRSPTVVPAKPSRPPARNPIGATPDLAGLSQPAVQPGRVEVIERCGHHPWVEQPVAFRQAVDAYLADLNSRC